MVQEKQAIMIILAIVVIVAIPGMIIKMNMSNTGEFYYAGNMIQFESPQEACNQISCAGGPAEVLETTGNIWPYSNTAMTVKCYCPENPGEIFYVPMVMPY
jgi:hypothetical protein